MAALLPEGLGPSIAILLIVASFFTSALTAAFGIGGGIAMLALMGLFVPVAALIPVHGAVQLGSNVGRAWYQRAHIRRDIMLPFAIGSLVGAPAGALFVVQLPDAALKLVLAAFIILVTWVSMPGLGRPGRLGLGLGGAVVAAMTMFVGATGPLLASLFARVVPADRRALIATLATGMSLHHFLKIALFGMAGFAFAAWLPLIVAMIAAGYLGTVQGSRWLERIPERAFRFWFRIGLTLLAVELVRQGMAGMLSPN